MIKKEYRLTEREVKKVLWKWKPFFSYSIVLNYLKNKWENHRFAIVLWSKPVKNSVERNFFRRLFYDTVGDFLLDKKEKNTALDMVFVVKKKTKLDKKNESLINDFRKEINFLFNKVVWAWKKY